MCTCVYAFALLQVCGLHVYQFVYFNVFFCVCVCSLIKEVVLLFCCFLHETWKEGWGVPYLKGLTLTFSLHTVNVLCIYKNTCNIQQFTMLPPQYFCFKRNKVKNNNVPHGTIGLPVPCLISTLV